MYKMIPFGRYIGNFNSLFDELERSVLAGGPDRPAPFRTDIKDEDGHFLLEAELPGFTKEDIDLELKDGILTVSAKHEQTLENKDEGGKYICKERRFGSFSRSFDVSGIQEDSIQAAYENGVLKLTLPKQAELQPQSRKIAIE